MTVTRTYYEVLGLPKDATLAQIKRRYRQLAQKYHPDVAVDKEQATRMFIAVTEAYDALTDVNRRKAYDANIELEAAKAASRETERLRHERPAQPSEDVSKLLSEAQYAYINKRFSDAAALCKRAIAANPRSAKAYAMLGDVYKALRKPAEAVKYYSYAIQFDANDRESNKKLMDLIGKQAARAARGQSVERTVTQARIAANITLFTVAAFLLFAITLSPGKPIPLLKTYLPPAHLWSLNLAVLVAASSVIVGFALAINGVLANPDEELIFEGGASWAVIPAGLILLLGSGLFFPGAAAFYLVVGLAQGSLSKSVMTIFACVMTVVLVAALMYNEQAIKQVLLFGGNVSFIPMLVGWYLGAAFRPLNE